MTPLGLVTVLALLVCGLADSVSVQQEQRVLGPDRSSSGIASNVGDKIRKQLKKAEIIPTVVDDFAPSLVLHAVWSSKQKVSLGNTLKPKKLQDAPSISLHDPSKSSGFCTSGANYVIIFTDPDAPSREDPKWSEMCHWIATGVATSASAEHDAGCSALHLDGLDEVVPYKAPGPPEKTGKHRYVFLALAPGNGTTEKLHLSKPSDRQHWGYDTDDGETRGVRDWAKENGLVPIAANFIYAKNKKQ